MLSGPTMVQACNGYVWDADTLVDNLTVREMLMYTAELKLPMSQSMEEKRERVKHIIELLALGACQNRRIGNAMARGISGTRALNLASVRFTAMHLQRYRMHASHLSYH